MMKFVVFVLVAFATVAFGQFAIQLSQENIDAQFENFKKEYYRVYQTAEEEQSRKAIFAENLHFILDSNSHYFRGHRKFQVEVNNFTDYSDEEFKQIFLSHPIRADQPRPPNVQVHRDPENVDISDGADWGKGVVTPVKNQGKIASGWAFAAVAALEAAHTLRTAWFHLTPLSEQNLIDCATVQGNAKMGTIDAAFVYVLANHGIESDKSYPYEGTQGQCRYKPASSSATIARYVAVDQNERALHDAVSNIGPIAATIDASQKSFRFYQSGVYDEPKCSNELLNHGIAITGYDNDVWHLKNSFGTDWGEQGHMQLTRSKGNLCGIYSQASYPVVE